MNIKEDFNTKCYGKRFFGNAARNDFMRRRKLLINF